MTTIAWDKSCLSTDNNKTVDKIDIYLYAPQSASSFLPIHAWTNIPAGNGQYDVKLAPKWWNATANVQLALNIVTSGNEPWDTSNPTGPTWDAVYKAPTDGSAAPADAVVGSTDSSSSSLISVFYSGGGLTKGGMAAAIICPLVVFFCALGLWIRRLHMKREDKTANWADHMDKRMSRISLDWTSGGDGSAGPVPGSRPASFFPRERSDSLASDGAGFAGRGARPRMPRHLDDMDPAFATDEEMRERPRGMSMYDEGNRTSRISFAPSTGGDRISRISFAPSSQDHGRPSISNRGHKSSLSLPRLGQNRIDRDSRYSDAPAVPKLDTRFSRVENNRDSRYSANNAAYASDADYEEAAEDEDEDELTMSPTQHDGPMPLGTAEVDRMRHSLDAGRALDGGRSNTRNEVGDDDADREFRDSVLRYPALSMMTSGRDASDGSDMFAAMTTRPMSGMTDASNRNSAYIDHEHYAPTAGARALSPEHPARSSVIPQTGMEAPLNLSPDEAMKQYAALRGGATSPTAGPAGTATMRTLYAPTSSPAAPAAAADRASSVYGNAAVSLDAHMGHRAQQHSVAGSSLNEDEVVGYNEMIDHAIAH